MRSALSHGARHGGLGDEDFEVYKRCESVLREALMRAIVELEFRDVFLTNNTIDDAFPVSAPEPRLTRCHQCGADVRLRQ
jgi:hypothetical protein